MRSAQFQINADVFGGDSNLGLNEHQALPVKMSPKGSPNTYLTVKGVTLMYW